MQNTFYTIARTSTRKINNRKKATPDNLVTVWVYLNNDDLDRFPSFEKAQRWAQDEEYGRYKIYKSTVVDEVDRRPVQEVVQDWHIKNSK